MSGCSSFWCGGRVRIEPERGSAREPVFEAAPRARKMPQCREDTTFPHSPQRASPRSRLPTASASTSSRSSTALHRGSCREACSGSPKERRRREAGARQNPGIVSSVGSMEGKPGNGRVADPHCGSVPGPHVGGFTDTFQELESRPGPRGGGLQGAEKSLPTKGSRPQWGRREKKDAD